MTTKRKKRGLKNEGITKVPKGFVDMFVVQKNGVIRKTRQARKKKRL